MASTLSAVRPVNLNAGGGMAPPAEELIGAMSVARIGIIILTVISICIIILSAMNIKMGHGATTTHENKTQDEAEEKKETYPNKFRDYIILGAAILSTLVSVPSAMMTYPKSKK
uniref:Wsv414-like protein n=1 Tax=Metapenaeus ensis nimavirus TaxID=2133794 RepID=A0A401IPE4_9VIRU|nr:MAG: wsv414-like protein [Metapenaeus ensis nimavirus]GBG35485.1 wsv414-like protein [Metapenaeus ensis nimavirus]